jgi:hypothetical protein
MILTRSVVVVVACMLLCAVSAPAQTPEELQNDRTIAATRASNDVHQLVKDLSAARKSGDVARATELQSSLFAILPTLPIDTETMIHSGIREDMPEVKTGPLWGNDVKIHSGPLWSYGKRQLAMDADTLKGIYVALNAKYQDTLSYIRVYRSTNEGLNWSIVGGFYSAGRAIQSFDMCVTDSLAGKWLLGFAFVVKTDANTNGGGHLYWGSMLSDGSDWRYTLIASANSTINFRNPSICTDGTYYTPQLTFHYIAAEFTTPATDVSRGLYITRSTNWGKNWTAPDTTLRGVQEGTPAIAIDWSTNPDSLCIAFTRYAAPSREIRTARNAFTFPGAWTITYPSGAKDDYDPSMAIDPVRGNAIITYTRATGSPTYNDAMYLYSTDLFKTFTRDSIATSTAYEELTSVSYAPWLTGYYWRVAYRTTAGSDTIYYKAILNKLAGFHSSAPTVVSQYRPTATLIPVVGYDRDIGGTSYRGNCIYAGYGAQDVYFDAVDMALDVPDQEGIPTTFALRQNYPNPFNPSTTLGYTIAGTGHEAIGSSWVKLAVYDMLGREVAVLVNEPKPAGNYTVKFDGSGLASGVYIYRLAAGNFVDTKKLVLLK